MGSRLISKATPSSELSGVTWSGSQWVQSNQSAQLIYNSRDELNGSEASTTHPPGVALPGAPMAVYANGIALQGVWDYANGAYLRGQYFGPYQAPKGQPNMLDGFELSRTGDDYSGGNGSVAPYVTTNNYDASGRLLESGTTECPSDPNFAGSVNPNFTDEQFRYDAEDHTIKSTITGGYTNQPQSSCTIPANATQIYNYDWGVNGHPWKLTSIDSITAYEYLHWDGDTLLFTSSSPASGMDDIKIGSFGDLTSDGAIAVYDRSSDGSLVDAHSTFASTRNVSYNDYFSPGSATVLRLCGLAYAQPCIVITEPKPENLGGWIGVNIQGVRAIEPTLGHWTTPDAYSGTVHDPASQKPYMYERNNSYAYSDPTGLDAIWMVWRRVWGPDAEWYERALQQGSDGNHVYTVIFRDDGSSEHYSFGPKTDKKGVKRLVLEPEGYEDGSVWVASKLIAKCSGVCTKSNGGFDEKLMRDIFEQFAMANLKYGNQNAPNSGTPQWMACHNSGGDCTTPAGAGVPYGFEDWRPPKKKQGP